MVKQITQGCAATYSLIDFFGDDINTHNHHQRSPHHTEEVKKVFYVACNPYDYVISSFRRTKSCVGELILGSDEFFEHNFNLVHTLQCGGDYLYFLNNPLKSFDINLFLIDPYDPYLYMSHIYGYINNNKRTYDFMFLKYDLLNSKDSFSRLVDFVGSDRDPKEFEFKERQSNYLNIGKEERSLLEKKYKNEMTRFEELPDIFYAKAQN